MNAKRQRTIKQTLIGPLLGAVLLLMCGGCSALKDPAFWAAVSQANTGAYPQPSAYAPASPAGSGLTPQSGELLLFGGRDHSVLLGCLNCGKYDIGSIWNKYGDYGSKFADKSIWNKFGTYGSKFSDESPWNLYGQAPPVIVDRQGGFYGYFTANTSIPNRTTIGAALKIVENYEALMENFDAR